MALKRRRASFRNGAVPQGDHASRSPNVVEVSPELLVERLFDIFSSKADELSTVV